MPLLVPPRKERSVSAKELAIQDYTHSTRLPLEIGLDRLWNKCGSGIKYQINVKYRSGTGRQRFRNMLLLQGQIFHGYRIFQHLKHMTSFKSVYIVFEDGKYHSWPNTLPFRVVCWGTNTHTSRSDPNTRSISNKICADINFIRLFWAIIFEIVLDLSLTMLVIAFRADRFVW